MCNFYAFVFMNCGLKTLIIIFTAIMKQKPVAPAFQHFLDGDMILIHKPLHWTSFDAVKKVRILTGISKVGHAGTLDPLATGLLIICTGRATKKINEYMGMEKEYTGSMIIGATTATYDRESKPVNFVSYAQINEEQLQSAAEKFIGNIQQLPPMHSAVKKDGKPLYLLARAGKEVALEPRQVIIHEFELTNIQLPEIFFRVVCTTGTYIRSLVNDFGNTIQTGAYLSSLCRTRIGKYLLKDAKTIGEFELQINQLKQSSEGQSNT